MPAQLQIVINSLFCRPALTHASACQSETGGNADTSLQTAVIHILFAFPPWAQLVTATCTSAAGDRQKAVVQGDDADGDDEAAEQLPHPSQGSLQGSGHDKASHQITITPDTANGARCRIALPCLRPCPGDHVDGWSCSFLSVCCLCIVWI